MIHSIKSFSQIMPLTVTLQSPNGMQMPDVGLCQETEKVQRKMRLGNATARWGLTSTG